MDRQTHKQRMTLMATAVLVPLMAACGSERAGAGSASAEAERPVTGIRWSVDSVTADGTTLRAPVDAHVTIEDDGRTSGRYACNHFRGEADFDGDRVRFNIDTTLAACDDEPRKTFERTLQSTLKDGALKTRVNDDRLTLTADDGATVRLSKGEDSPLYGTKWTLTVPDAEGRARLTFDKKEGTVSGSLGCNYLNADATVRDGHITLGTPTTTSKMCEDSLMDTERTLLRLFDGTLTYDVEYRNLTLTSENGTRVDAFATE